MKLYIKNMACESCKILVRAELKNLGIQPVKVELGEAEVKGAIPPTKKSKFQSAIKKAGLELVDAAQGVLVDRIKEGIADFLQNKKRIKVNLSEYLSHRLHRDYNALSGYFSEMEAVTIEQYAIALKIEKAKEMLVVEDYSHKEIADKLDYSSTSHLSRQFKQVTGLNASHFKKLKVLRRRTIQEL